MFQASVQIVTSLIYEVYLNVVRTLQVGTLTVLATVYTVTRISED